MSIPEQHDRVFKALGSQVRRQILDDLRDQPLTTGTLVAHFPELDRCTVMQHLKVLEDAELVIPVRNGPHAAHATARLAKLKRDLERTP
jgi:DNA-binding transcriptional ArsR family regulator